ncbi:hypothetical protein K461DRAFT_270134 [Myriangium duriaei CBS 260.36]|uniref:Uncharacterized protein n=1 Tax=Myriangium duriaei CBS 260.36 TaxID=1168546 RepID=A0A9P4IVI5_9PEZI|nr:hypothetical protein K461DRAFT_270134 [Myriangium duriaei CBS 260.36]
MPRARGKVWSPPQAQLRLTARPLACFISRHLCTKASRLYASPPLIVAVRRQPPRACAAGQPPTQSPRPKCSNATCHMPPSRWRHLTSRPPSIISERRLIHTPPPLPYIRAWTRRSVL